MAERRVGWHGLHGAGDHVRRRCIVQPIGLPWGFGRASMARPRPARQAAGGLGARLPVRLVGPLHQPDQVLGILGRYAFVAEPLCRPRRRVERFAHQIHPSGGRIYHARAIANDRGAAGDAVTSSNSPNAQWIVEKNATASPRLKLAMRRGERHAARSQSGPPREDLQTCVQGRRAPVRKTLFHLSVSPQSLHQSPQLTSRE